MPTFYKEGGGSLKILLESASILRVSHKVLIKGPFAEADLENFEIPQSLDRLSKIFVVIKAMKAFFCEINTIKEIKPDIIYVHDMPSLYYYGIIAKILKIKVVWHIHESEIYRIKRKINFFLSNKRIYISKFQMQEKDKSFCFIRNPVDLLDIDAKDIKYISNTKKIAFGIIGRVNKNKNQKFAIDFAKRTKNILNIYGAIDDYDYFNELDINNKNVFYKGYLDLRDILCDIDIVFLPSFSESQGLAFLEAIANGKLVLAPSIIAFREIAENIGYEKYLYVQEDMDSCQEKLNMLLSIEDDMINNFKDKVMEFYSPLKFRNKLIKCFENISNRKQI